MDELAAGICLTTALLLLWAAPTFAIESPAGGALAGERPRVIVSSDIGGSDDDDRQSMVHYLVYADVFDTEGLISSPPGGGRAKDITEVIDLYEKDYPTLVTHSASYPRADALRKLTKQGAVDRSPDGKGWSRPTEGSDWIVTCARREDARPLYVLVWGAITDVAQAVHDAPDIKKKMRIYFIASWNRRQDPAAYDYLRREHLDLWIIQSETTFRGWYVGGDQKDDLGNEAFVQEHVKGHGALGDFMAPLKGGSIKMGDTPSVAYLLRGDPADPTAEHWGGRYVPERGRPTWWGDDTSDAEREGKYRGARTVNRYRWNYLRDFQTRMRRARWPAVTSM